MSQRPPAIASPTGFIGLGVMGQPMALNLVRSGVQLHVWNRTQERCAPLVAEGAKQAPTIEALFAACQVIILMLADEHATDAVLHRSGGKFESLVKGKLIIVMGTNSPDWSQALAGDLQAAGAEYVEAPVSGSRQPAIDGRLVAMIAGPSEEARAGVAQLVSPMCRQVIDAGRVPSALHLKLSVNLYLITMVSGLAEAACLARRLGLEWQLLQSVLDAGPMASEVSRMKLAKLVAGDMSVQASIRDVLMNCRLIANAAQDAAFNAPLLKRSLRQFDAAQEDGLGDLDMIGVIAAANAPGPAEGEPVARQLDAYNRRELDRFMDCWHDDAIVVSHPDSVLLKGADEIREHHRRRFEDPTLKALLLDRTVVGNVVVDREWARRTGEKGIEHYEVLAIYTVEFGRIIHAAFRQVVRPPAF